MTAKVVRVAGVTLLLLLLLLATSVLGWRLWALARWRHRGLRMSPGTDQFLLTRHNDTRVVDVEGYALTPAFVRSCLLDLAAIPPGNNRVTSLSRPVQRAIPDLLPLDSEWTRDFNFRSISQESLLAYCSSLEALPSLPRPLCEIVVRRANAPAPGGAPTNPGVDFWTPTNESFNSKSPALLLLVDALEEMQNLSPTPGRIQEIHKPFGSPIRNWIRQTRGYPIAEFDANPAREIAFLKRHYEWFSHRPFPPKP